jgi:hypothetical protein
VTEFIRGGGACIVSVNVLSGASPLKWANREEPLGGPDNGWRFLSMIDDDEFLSDPDNLQVADINRVIEIEPAILAIYLMPVGTDVQLVTEPGGAISIYDNHTGRKLDV